MEEGRRAFKIVTGISAVKRPLEWSRRKEKCKLKIELKVMSVSEKN
jgi:hypothetical protein